MFERKLDIKRHIIVSNETEWRFAEEILLENMKILKFIGLQLVDQGIDRRYTLLQLGTTCGTCIQIIVIKKKSLPDGLHKILSDKTFVKIGINLVDDVLHLKKYHGANLHGYFDIRYLINENQIRSIDLMDLSHISKSILGVLLADNLYEEPLSDEVCKEDMLDSAQQVLALINIFKSLVRDEFCGMKYEETASLGSKFMNMWGSSMECNYEKEKFYCGICGIYCVSHDHFYNHTHTFEHIKSYFYCTLKMNACYFIESRKQWEDIENVIEDELRDFKLLGFDLIPFDDSSFYVKLATITGFCYVIDLSKFSIVPFNLNKYLTSDDYVKVCIIHSSPAKRFYQETGIRLNGLFDVRHLVKDYPFEIPILNLNSIAKVLFDCVSPLNRYHLNGNYKENVEIWLASFEPLAAIRSFIKLSKLQTNSKLLAKFRNKWRNLFDKNYEEVNLFCLNCDVSFQNAADYKEHLGKKSHKKSTKHLR